MSVVAVVLAAQDRFRAAAGEAVPTLERSNAGRAVTQEALAALTKVVIAAKDLDAAVDALVQEMNTPTREGDPS